MVTQDIYIHLHSTRMLCTVPLFVHEHGRSRASDELNDVCQVDQVDGHLVVDVDQAQEQAVVAGPGEGADVIHVPEHAAPCHRLCDVLKKEEGFSAIEHTLSYFSTYVRIRIRFNNDFLDKNFKNSE